MRFALLFCSLFFAFENATFAKDPITMDSELTEGSIWEGTFKRYVGGKLDGTSSTKFTVTKREKDEFEAEMELTEFNRKFLLKGKLKGVKLTGGIAKVLEGEAAKDLIGNSKMSATLKVEKKKGEDDRITIKGTYIVPGTNRTAEWNLKPSDQ